MYQKCGCEMREFVCARSGSLFPLEKSDVYGISIFTLLAFVFSRVWVHAYSIYSILVGRHFLGDCYVSHAWSTCCCPLSVLIRALCPACRWISPAAVCLKPVKAAVTSHIWETNNQHPTASSQQPAGRRAAELVKFSGPRARFVGEAHAHRRTHTQAPVSQSIAILVSPWMRLCLHRI